MLRKQRIGVVLLAFVLCGSCQKEPPLTWQEIATAENFAASLPVLDPSGECGEYLKDYAKNGGSRMRLLAFTGCFLKPEANTRPHPDYTIDKIVVEAGLLMIRPRRPTPISPDALALIGLPYKEPSRIERNGEMSWIRAFEETCATPEWCAPDGVYFLVGDVPGQIDHIRFDFNGLDIPEPAPFQTENWILPRSRIARGQTKNNKTLVDITHTELRVDGHVLDVNHLGNASTSLHAQLMDFLMKERQRAALQRKPFEGHVRLRVTRLTTFMAFQGVVRELGRVQLHCQEMMVASQFGSERLDLKRADYGALRFVHRSQEEMLTLAVRVVPQGFDLFREGRKVSPVDGCPEHGATLCLRDRDAKPLELVALATEAEAKGDSAAATHLIERAADAYPWTALYNAAVRLKNDFPKKTYITVGADPSIPLALVVPVADALAVMRASPDGVCGAVLTEGALADAQPCASAEELGMPLFSDVNMWIDHVPN